MMQNTKTFILFLILLCGRMLLSAQTSTSSSCNTAVGICSSTSYTFPAGVNAGTAASGPNYGCLKTQPNPAWFFLQVQNSGSITFSMSSSPARDIDFIIWGPFSNPFAACGVQLDTTKIVSCSYSTASSETGVIPNGISGEYYILLITNYSNRSTNISFAQTSGTGTSNCDILCNITSLTATASSCGTGANLGTFSISGTLTTFTPPTIGTLTISSSCGSSVIYNPPFSGTINYTLPVVGGIGDTCIITASFSKVATCTKSVTVTSPVCCSVSVPSTSSVCQGRTLSLTASGTAGGTFVWQGPNSFNSTLQNPSIANTISANAGLYSVYLTYGGCTTPTKNTTVTVNPKPASKTITHR